MTNTEKPKKVILGVTGHRGSYLGSKGYSEETLSNLVRIISNFFDIVLKPDGIITGMALTFDTACAIAARNYGIPYIAAIPFKNQASKWNDINKSRYEDLLKSAYKVYYVDTLKNSKYNVKGVTTGQYSALKLIKRNEFIIDHCNRVLALYSGIEEGGTYHAIKYAESKGREVYNLWLAYRYLEDI